MTVKYSRTFVSSSIYYGPHTQAGEMICHPGRIDPDRDMIWDEQGIERGVHIQVCADRNSLGLVHTADPNN